MFDCHILRVIMISFILIEIIIFLLIGEEIIAFNAMISVILLSISGH
jgi:UPF0716 family protein affecting phage T7 exclusion